VEERAEAHRAKKFRERFERPDMNFEDDHEYSVEE